MNDNKSNLLDYVLGIILSVISFFIMLRPTKGSKKMMTYEVKDSFGNHMYF